MNGLSASIGVVVELHAYDDDDPVVGLLTTFS